MKRSWELLEITQDICDIAQRLKEVDSHYHLMYNRRLHRLELYDDMLADGLACVFPFDRVDARCVEYARKTRVENLHRLMRELDAENERRVL